MHALTTLALLLGATAVALSVVALLREDDQRWREVRLGLAEKEDEFKFSDVAPEGRSEEDISAGDSFVFSGDVSGERRGRLAGSCDVADKASPPATRPTRSTMAKSQLPVYRTSASKPRRSSFR